MPPPKEDPGGIVGNPCLGKGLCDNVASLQASLHISRQRIAPEPHHLRPVEIEEALHLLAGQRLVDWAGELLQRLVAPGADIGNDAVHHVLHVLFRADIAVQNFFGLYFIKIIQANHWASASFSLFKSSVTR